MEVRNSEPNVKIFISYSWTNEEFTTWVREEIAERLESDGVEVVFDQWDLQDGHDVYTFMERAVNDKEISKVLVICDKGYKEKADSRRGGVGTETLIITPNVYKEVTQTKFIPIIAERDAEGKDYVPTYMEGRKYIDMSNEELYVENYDQLLRTIYERPSNRRPKRGKVPAFLFEDEEVESYKFHLLLKQIQMDLSKERLVAAKSKIIEFKSNFIDSLETFKVYHLENPELTAQAVEDKIDNMLILRNDFIELLEKCISSDILSVDLLIEFFEDMYNKFIDVRSQIQSKGTFLRFQFDHFKFFLKEIFIYTCAILLKAERYSLLSDFLYSRFLIYRDYPSNGKESRGFETFNSYMSSLDDIQGKKQGNRFYNYSYSAEKMIRRATKKYSQEYLANTDLLLFYLSAMNNKENEWYPSSYIYAENTRIELLQKLESSRYFEKVKVLFDVETKEALIEKFSNFEVSYQDAQGFRNRVPNIQNHIDFSNICIHR
ncbi:toll/interleukin-1 receptor domain-containing protein [Priestia megaterium]|uniref:toll/interleukin-1 receptor domain-containing protein n=1 Tax=Priestia megaterium TaxID=1404 RepID=UPI0035B5F2D5